MLAAALAQEGPSQGTLAQGLVDSVGGDISSIYAHPNVDPTTIRTMGVLSIYHLLCDQQLFAWRTIGIAARLVLEIGLHRRESLLTGFPDATDRDAATAVFWCVCVLDRQCGLENGLSFALIDRDIDPGLPEPGPHLPYLQSLAGYGRLCSKVWDAVPHFSSATTAPPSFNPTLDLSIPSVIASQLDQEIRAWLRASTSIAAANLHASETQKSLLLLRGNHLLLLIHRQHVLSPLAVAANPDLAALAACTARTTIQATLALSGDGDGGNARNQATCNTYLVSALGVLLLAVTHAPGEFAEACRDDFTAAVELVRRSSEQSAAGRRLWKSVRGVVEAVKKLGLGPVPVPGRTGIDDDGGTRIDDSVQNPPLEVVQDWNVNFDSHNGAYSVPGRAPVGEDLLGLFDLFGGGGLQPTLVRGTEDNPYGTGIGWEGHGSPR
ncbi:hypothetical protein OQA88_1459 [Cercophora sp. LCS_1]